LSLPDFAFSSSTSITAPVSASIWASMTLFSAMRTSTSHTSPSCFRSLPSHKSDERLQHTVCLRSHQLKGLLHIAETESMCRQRQWIDAPGFQEPHQPFHPFGSAGAQPGPDDLVAHP